MQASEAIARAKDTIRELFADENISNLGLEEVVRNGDIWEVTVGFSRPWESIRDAHSMITGVPTLQRSYKKVQISDSDNELIRVVNG